MSKENDFESQAAARSWGLFGEFWYFLRHNKLWWLTPIIVVMLVLSILIIVGGTGAAPLIYTLF
jgi:hypothetical protein